MQEWAKVPIFDRKQGQPGNVLDLENRKDKVAKKYAVITSDGEEIHKCIEVCEDLISYLFCVQLLSTR